MREIKFRAFEPEGMGMFNIARYDFADNSVYHHLFADAWHLREDLSVMQFIGERDINGIEIYEGDITRYYNSEGEHIGVVKYTNTRFVTKGVNLHGFEWRFVEVIGNVWENPEMVGV